MFDKLIIVFILLSKSILSENSIYIFYGLLVSYIMTLSLNFIIHAIDIEFIYLYK